jgi:hypothetical protein
MSGDVIGVIGPATKAILSNLVQRKTTSQGQICFVAACVCSTWRGFCPWVLGSGLFLGIFLSLLGLMRSRQEYALRVKLLEILEEQGHAKNLNKVSLEKVFAEFDHIAPGA